MELPPGLVGWDNIDHIVTFSPIPPMRDFGYQCIEMYGVCHLSLKFIEISLRESQLGHS